ncbi:Baseplate J family protein [Burkholderia pseudomultivorans]|uniref:Baseplate J family protein n=1 Tax=Burkholderia pseudomultivorans TaxID=1207504 RepID=A0A6P2P0T3_9BURK|nr:Baseplate J family protein [Burkholderia pseudomultivorans]
MTPSQPMRPPRGRTPSPHISGRVAALYSVLWCVRRCAQQSAHVVTRPPCCRLPPVPPASRNGRATARTLRKGGRAGELFHRERAGSARESWFSGASARKSLIVEKSAAMCRSPFATSRGVFATSPVFAPTAAAPFSLLSNSLKKKKKESKEEAGTGRNRAPRVLCVLPSVTDAAYFLGHESEGAATGFSWQMMAGEIIKNQSVTHERQGAPRIHELFCPSPCRVALGR